MIVDNPLELFWNERICLEIKKEGRDGSIRRSEKRF